ncbi:unnamed protein product [Caenorhabditis brenneri]
MSWSPIGRPIRVGLFEHGPDTFGCFRQMPQKPCKKPGSEVEVLEMVMKILDWQWETVDTEREFNVLNDYGTLQPNGNFSGIMGLLAEDKIDMSGTVMSITPSRMAVAHFTFPVRYFQQVYITRNPPENDFRNFIFTPFSTEVWLILLAIMFGVSTMKFICDVCWDRQTRSKLNTYAYDVMETFGQMLSQGIRDPTAISTMFLEGFLLISMFNISQYYQTFMNSHLTAPPTSQIPFYHQNQLIDLLLKKETYLTFYFNYTPEGSTKKNEEDLKRALNINPIVTHDNTEDVAREIQKGGVMYSTYDIELLPQVVSVYDRSFNLIIIKDTTGVVSQAGYAFSSSNKKLCRMLVSNLSVRLQKPTIAVKIKLDKFLINALQVQQSPYKNASWYSHYHF